MGFGDECNHVCEELDASTAPDAWGPELEKSLLCRTFGSLAVVGGGSPG